MGKSIRPHLFTGRINDGRTTACGLPRTTRTVVVSMYEFSQLDERCLPCVNAWNALPYAANMSPLQKEAEWSLAERIANPIGNDRSEKKQSGKAE